VKKSIDSAWQYCEAMLPLVSRTFALNIARLEGPLYRAVLVGYLLFRMADTLEDSPALTEEEKITGLKHFARLFRDPNPSDAYAKTISAVSAKLSISDDENNLMVHGDLVFACFSSLPRATQAIITRALRESAIGMAEYQSRKKGIQIYQLDDEKELVRYCYFVAGVVGKMLTELFCLDPKLASYKVGLAKQQIYFGVALQLTNVIKDYPKDLKRGWCYIPRTVTDRLGIDLEDLVSNPFKARRSINRHMIPKTLPYLDGAYRYIALLPISQHEIRMFCIIPFVLAYHTLAHLARTQQEKLSRRQVQQLLEISGDFCQSNELLKADYEHTLRDPITHES